MPNKPSDNCPLKYEKEVQVLALYVAELFGRYDLVGDIEQIGYVALLEMPERVRARSKRYILATVKNDMIDGVRRARYLNDYSGKFLHFPYFSLEYELKKVAMGSSKPGILADVVRNGCEDFTVKPRYGRIELFDALDRIKNAQAKLLILYWVRGHTQREIAQMYGVSRSMIARRLKQALRVCEERAMEAKRI